MRYADDFVILARYQGSRLREWIEAKIETWLGLELNREKTRVVNVRGSGESLDFLGYTFSYKPDKFGRNKPYLSMAPSKKTLHREREKLREMTGSKYCFKPVMKMIGEINRHLQGWSNYFKLGYLREAFRAINWYTRVRMRIHLRRRSQRPYRPPKGVTMYEQLKRLGLIYL